MLSFSPACRLFRVLDTHYKRARARVGIVALILLQSFCFKFFAVSYTTKGIQTASRIPPLMTYDLIGRTRPELPPMRACYASLLRNQLFRPRCIFTLKTTVAVTALSSIKYGKTTFFVVVTTRTRCRLWGSLGVYLMRGRGHSRKGCTSCL